MGITFHPDGRVEGSGADNFGASGQVIQTVIGANGEVNTSSVAINSNDVNNPTFLNSNCIVTITPKRANSKILLTWTAQIRLNPSSTAYFGVYYSPNSNMSSPAFVEKYRGSSFNETYRTVNSGNYNNYMFEAWSRISWDETITNTNTRYYNVGAYKSGGDVYYGDHGTALQIMAQEVAA